MMVADHGDLPSSGRGVRPLASEGPMKSKTSSSADALVGDNTPDMFPVFRDCVDPSLIPASDGWEAARGGISRVFLPFKEKIKLHPVLPTPRQRTCSRLVGENYARRETSVQIPQTSRLYFQLLC